MTAQQIREAFRTLGVDESALQSQILESFRGQSAEDRTALVAQLASELGVETKTVGDLSEYGEDVVAAQLSSKDLKALRRAGKVLRRILQ